MRNILAALGKIGILGLILIAFAFGLAGTVYLSLRSPNVEVPDVTNRSMRDGETALESAGLSLRERAKRFKSGVEPGMILDQFPRGGAIVKQGQTVAVIVSRAPKEGERPTSDEIVEKEEEKQQPSESSNTNQNRERRRTNRNTNTNASPNANNQSAPNGNTAGTSNNSANTSNTNRAPNQNSNRNANSGRNANSNDNRGKSANNRAPNANNSRGSNNSRNTNRRPNQ